MNDQFTRYNYLNYNFIDVKVKLYVLLLNNYNYFYVQYH